MAASSSCRFVVSIEINMLNLLSRCQILKIDFDKTKEIIYRSLKFFPYDEKYDYKLVTTLIDCIRNDIHRRVRKGTLGD